MPAPMPKQLGAQYFDIVFKVMNGYQLVLQKKVKHAYPFENHANVY
jgi:hypothetical protein